MTRAGGAGSPHDPLARTRRRLFVVTLTLTGALIVLIGTASTFVTLRALDQDVDRALESAARAALSRYGDERGSETDATDGNEVGDSPAVAAPPTTDSDTFFLVLDATGALVYTPGGTTHGDGLPSADAVATARTVGSDLRTMTEADGRPLRLLTLPVVHEGAITGFLQTAYVLTLHDRQSRSLVLAILGVGLIGLAGAALVTYWVVGRALIPIRAAFATERRFVADASHEIRTPAAIIRASAEVLEREGLVRDDGRTLVDGIVAEADRLGRLVDDLLSLAASERGALSVERHPIDLGRVARSTVARALPLATERGVQLVGPTDEVATLPVSGDAERLTQVLLILLDNAFRHSPPNGQVAVTATRVGRRGEIWVDDQGPGVPEGARRTIFEPFARLADGRRRAANGAGLGLAIAARLVGLHGGTLVVTDAPGGGARFVLGVPLT